MTSWIPRYRSIVGYFPSRIFYSYYERNKKFTSLITKHFRSFNEFKYVGHLLSGSET